MIDAHFQETLDWNSIADELAVGSTRCAVIIKTHIGIGNPSDILEDLVAILS
jgi:hypothetical protein